MIANTHPANHGLALGADIGGTKTLLALAHVDSGAVVFERRYASREHADFASLLRAFLAASGLSGRIGGAGLGVAGPVAGNRSKVTYLPWIIDGAALASEFGIGGVRVVNDFEAAARGIERLAPSALVTLQNGEPDAHGTRVVIGAGTGLGVAALLPQDGGWRALAGEGGHIGFAPADAEQVELWHSLNEGVRPVSAERVVSGPGLVAIYRHLQQRHGNPDVQSLSPSGMPDPLLSPDPAAAIGAQALAEPQSLSSRALELFVRAYGAFAGDLALLFMARGGVYLAGGIAPKILPRLQGESFLGAFRNKAQHAALMEHFPIRAVTDEKLGLKGALAIAADVSKE